MNFSPDAYTHAYAVFRAENQSPVPHAGTDFYDMADIGTPMPYNDMPDPEALNIESAFDSKGHINALSRNAPKMMFNAELAVKGTQLPARALVDTRATHCYISEQFAKQLDLPLRHKPTWLTLANGKKAISQGTVIIPLDVQTYQGAVECFILPMSDAFDVILGETWCEETSCEISYKTYSLTCADSNGHRHKLLTQSTQTTSLCPIVSAMHLHDTLDDDDLIYLVNVIEGHEHVNAVQSEPLPQDAELTALLNEYRDVFPSELPAKLPPERSVYHAIPLKDSVAPSKRKMYRLSQHEVAELNAQVASLLEKGYIQPSNSPYGHPVLFVKKKNGNLRMCVTTGHSMNKLSKADILCHA